MSAENDIVERLPRWKTGPVLREHPGYFLVPVADIDEAAAEIVRLRGELALAAGWHLESIAPAEAKGGACGCGEATCVEPWEPGCGLGTSIEHARVSPQPAGGEAVAWMTPGGDVSRSLLWCEERCLPGQKPTPLYTTPPAAQVQESEFVHGEYIRGFNDGVKATNSAFDALGVVMERDALKEQLHDEIAANHAFREAGGALRDEDMPTFCGRIIAERTAVRRIIENWRHDAEVVEIARLGRNALRACADELEAALQHRGDSRGGEG